MHKVGNKIECNNMHGERIKVIETSKKLAIATRTINAIETSEKIGIATCTTVLQ